MTSPLALLLLAMTPAASLAIPHSHAHAHSDAHNAVELLASGLSAAHVAVGRHSDADARPALIAVALPLSAVALAPDSLYGIAQRRNLEFQLSLNDTQWLCQMTSAANLTSCVGKCATPGGPGMPPCEQLPGEMGPGGYYGHYQGHYLSGAAMMWNNTRDARIKAKADGLIAAMAKVQAAWGKHGAKGYIFPNYPDTFGIMEVRCGMPGPHVDYSVPYYTLHKIMAGLLDQHSLAHNPQALGMLTQLADWVVLRVEAVLARGGQALWQCTLGTEWGGMNEVLYNLYALTGNEAYYKTGLRFNHWQWTAPLAAGQDDIDGSHGNGGGNHANTHIPEIIGSARGYELTGNETQKAIALNFFDIVTSKHSWATGGSNAGEHWTTPERMGDQLNADTEESCTQYNILKVARHLFRWTASAKMADFYERAIMNGIIGNQNKLDASMTQFIYMLPLGAAHMHKPWGKSDQGFPCCWGTLTEQFSKLSDSIYFASADHSALFVNQFMSSTISWPQHGLVLTQKAGFPASLSSTTTITIDQVLGSSAGFTLKLRVPAWATSSLNHVTLNGEAVGGAPYTPGEYLSLQRTWVQGDVLEVHFPLSLSYSLVQDNRSAYNHTMAWMYGPLVLAGVDASSVFFSPLGGSQGRDPAQFITRNSSTALTFEARGQDPLTRAPLSMGMKPLYEIMEEDYAVYFTCGGPPSPVTYAAGGAAVPSATAGDWSFAGAATAAGNFEGQTDIRTTGPGVTSHLTLIHALLGKGHAIERVELSFRYLSGYDSGAGAWPVLTLDLVDAETQQPATPTPLWTSPPLDKYKFDSHMPYSPPLLVASAPGLKVDNTRALYVRLSIQNHARNVQIPLDPSIGLNVTVHWAAPAPRFTHAQFGQGLGAVGSTEGSAAAADEL